MAWKNLVLLALFSINVNSKIVSGHIQYIFCLVHQVLWFLSSRIIFMQLLSLAFPIISTSFHSFRYWGENYSKLLDIKHYWDPDNIINHCQSVGSTDDSCCRIQENSTKFFFTFCWFFPCHFLVFSWFSSQIKTTNYPKVVYYQEKTSKKYITSEIPSLELVYKLSASVSCLIQKDALLFPVTWL